MITQNIVKDDLTLVDVKEVGIYKMFHQLLNQVPQPTTDEERFIGVKELCKRLSIAQQTAYNRTGSGVWVEGVHFFKPTRGKLLFKWSAMLEWTKASEQISPTEYDHTTDEPILHNEQSHQSSVKMKRTPPTNKDYVNI
jgi:hypothetical protein